MQAFKRIRRGSCWKQEEFRPQEQEWQVQSQKQDPILRRRVRRSAVQQTLEDPSASRRTDLKVSCGLLEMPIKDSEES